MEVPYRFSPPSRSIGSVNGIFIDTSDECRVVFHAVLKVNFISFLHLSGHMIGISQTISTNPGKLDRFEYFNWLVYNIITLILLILIVRKSVCFVVAIDRVELHAFLRNIMILISSSLMMTSIFGGSVLF